MTAFPGDDLIASPAAVMDRTAVFDVPAAQLWPWVEQLGKGRGRWYATRTVERLLPLRYRALRHTGEHSLTVGDVVPDYGPDGSFTVVRLEAPHVLVYLSERKTVMFAGLRERVS